MVRKKTGNTSGEHKPNILAGRELTKEESERIRNNFTYHAPFGDQSEKYTFIGNQAKEFAEILCSLCPPSRELSLALTELEKAVSWANASIGRHEIQGKKDDSD